MSDAVACRQLGSHRRIKGETRCQRCGRGVLWAKLPIMTWDPDLERFTVTTTIKRRQPCQ